MPSTPPRRGSRARTKSSKRSKGSGISERPFCKSLKFAVKDLWCSESKKGGRLKFEPPPTLYFLLVSLLLNHFLLRQILVVFSFAGFHCRFLKTRRSSNMQILERSLVAPAGFEPA